MPQCKNCLHHNRPGTLICDKCGVALYGAMASVARTLPEDSAKKTLVKPLVSFLSRLETKPLLDEEPTQRVIVPGSARTSEKYDPQDAVFPAGSSLLFQFGRHRIVVDAPSKDIWLGRFGGRVPPLESVHVVNFADLEGYRLGISRLHAIIRRTAQQRIEILDLSSSNGTYLNSHRLTPHDGYHLYDGDEIQLGRLRFNVYFLYA